MAFLFFIFAVEYSKFALDGVIRVGYLCGPDHLGIVNILAVLGVVLFGLLS